MNIGISTYTSPLNDPRGMKWHKFLIFFSLWLNAILNLVSGIIYFRALGESSGGLSSEGILSLGVLSVFCSIYAIIVRFKLARFEADAIGHLNSFLIMSLIGNVFACLMAYSYNYLSIIFMIVYIVLTNIYYKKRSDLFTN